MKLNYLTARLDFGGIAALEAAKKVNPASPLPAPFLAKNCAHQLAGIDALYKWVASKK